MALDHAPCVHTLMSLLEVRSTVEDAVRAEPSAFSYDEELVPKSALQADKTADSSVDPASRLMAGLGISSGQTEGNGETGEGNGEAEDEAGLAARIRAEEQARMKVRKRAD